jgi:hypothetical protein
MPKHQTTEGQEARFDFEDLSRGDVLHPHANVHEISNSLVVMDGWVASVRNEAMSSASLCGSARSGI